MIAVCFFFLTVVSLCLLTQVLLLQNKQVFVVVTSVVVLPPSAQSSGVPLLFVSGKIFFFPVASRSRLAVILSPLVIVVVALCSS